MEVESGQVYYGLPEPVGFQGGVRREGFSISKDGVRVLQERSGGDFCVEYMDDESGLNAYIFVKDNDISFAWGKQMLAVFNRKTGELMALSFGLTGILGVAQEEGLTLSRENVNLMDRMSSQGEDVQALVELRGEEPMMSFLAINRGVPVDDLGSLALVNNPIGAVGGREYLFMFAGQTPFSGIAMRIVARDRSFECALFNKREEEATILVSRYYNVSLLKGKDPWDSERVREAFSEAFPDCFR